MRIDLEKLDIEDIKEEEKERIKKGMKVHKHIGETARSVFERGINTKMILGN